MTDFLKMDVFFVVATIVTVLIGALVIIALVYVVRFLKTLNRIGDEVEQEAGAIRADIGEARARIKQEGFRIASIASILGTFGKKVGKRVTKRVTKREKRDTSS